jgi:flavin reductase (DIM6/NTAB) family NADH-FMN oxidoreductase RutF
VLVSIDRTVSSHAAISSAGMFAVNILSEDQADLSVRFASRIDDKFAGLGYHLSEYGLPLLKSTLGYVECRVVGELPGGDHTIFIGQALNGDVQPGQPLLYFRRAYHRLG